MKNFEDIKSFNKYIGLPEPLYDNIDAGYYNQAVFLKSESVMINFYRISFKINFIDKSVVNSKPIGIVFFNSPNRINNFNVESTYEGMYLQLSKKLIEENRFLFKSYLDYGEYETLYLTESEIQEIKTIFELMCKKHEENKINYEVLISYIHVLFSLVEAFYKRQFETRYKEYYHILSDFQKLVYEYYNKPVKQFPSVEYFADKLNLTTNYLGDIIKYFTQKSVIENVNEYIIKKAETLIKENSLLNNKKLASLLGLEYPSYVTDFFKKSLGLTPSQYRLKVLKKNK